jgi:hypothetical protein
LEECALITRKYAVFLTFVCAFAVLGASCGKDSPSAPSQPSVVTLSTPSIESPGTDEQLDTVRPTLKVRNGTSNVPSGARMYEFQLSTEDSFSNVALTRSIAESAAGMTSFAVDQDLQPTTRYYWRVRVSQGSTNSSWAAGTFKTRLVGYNRAGALYDPLVNSETVGRISGNITWMPGQGVRMNDQWAYVVYDIPQVFSSGEISLEATGLGLGGSPGKGRVFSILDRLGTMSSAAKYSINVQYRGVGGAPDNAIAWKAILGDNNNSVEPDTAERYGAVVILDPTKVYLFQAIWTPTSVRVVVKESNGGPTVYDHTEYAHSPTNWNPAAMYAFIGTNNASYTGFDGTREGMIVRNLWVGATPRPGALGSALQPLLSHPVARNFRSARN